MTNYIVTSQIQGKCDEEYSKPNAKCKTDTDCNGSFISSWNGIIKLYN
jgi:hypothetical protein